MGRSKNLLFHPAQASRISVRLIQEELRRDPFHQKETAAQTFGRRLGGRARNGFLFGVQGGLDDVPTVAILLRF